ncbi:MAG: ion transporter [Crocinitomicaceae bacterium]|nr:ion transporter [Crocinitomicaceae bacterium]
MKDWQIKLHTIIFEADTRAGKLFDVVLLWAILISVLLVMGESVKGLRIEYGRFFHIAEWFFTILFTLEYILRLICVHKPIKYIFSFYGIIDLLSIIPTYLALFFIDTRSLRVIRSLRLLRVFRVLKLGRFVKESDLLMEALKNSRYRITVFLFAVLAVTSIMGTVMYLVESPETGFTSIPRSIYWAIVTLTTVGFGDIAPQSDLGQFIASIVMVLGYAIIAIPTGIITGEVIKSTDTSNINTQVCINCQHDKHDTDAKYCKMCGTEL